MHVIGNKLKRVSRESDAQNHEFKTKINGASEAYICRLTNSYSYFKALHLSQQNEFPMKIQVVKRDSYGTVSHKLNPQIPSLKDD